MGVSVPSARPATGWAFVISGTAASDPPGLAESETDDGAALNGGTLASYPMGFTHWPVPEEIAAPQHCPSWDEPDE